MNKVIQVNDFEYDLWTTPDGKCFARVRATGAECELNKETMQVLRSCEKQLYREHQLFSILASVESVAKGKAYVRYPFSIDIISANEDITGTPAWLISNDNVEDEFIAATMEEQLLETLTDYQREAYRCVMKNGETQDSFALRHNISKQSAGRIIEKIQKKAKILFDGGVTF